MAQLATRTTVPQAFVSSYAPRIRAYVNSLVTPVQPATVIPPLRTTKRGTTAINYSEDFEDESIDDSDAPRRTARGRRLDDLQADKGGAQKEPGKELYAPVEVQAIWREWMGKPKRNLTEKQAQAQAVLPLHLVPIRIDLNVPPFIPEPALPKPHNAREMGLDEFAPAYRQPEITPEYRIKDYFLWNLHETLTTPDQFAKVFVDDLDLPNDRKQALIISMSQQIRSQLEEHAAVELHPYFARENSQPKQAAALRSRPALSRDQSSTPLPGTPAIAPFAEVNGSATPADPAVDSKAVVAVAERADTVLNPDDAHRCVISLSLNLQNRLLTDKFEWSLLHPPGLAEAFAKQTCADLGLSGEWVPALSHSIYEAVLKLKKDVVDNNGSLLGVVGSGVNAWGEIENETAEVHGDASLMVGEGAGWRFDNDALGIEWEPKIEFLSKDEIEKREGDRERQLRRMRRDMAARAAPQQRESFYGGLGEAGGDDERMGRGERAKKKRRFRSLSPGGGRDSPDVNGGFGGGSGEAGKLNDGERQSWRCSHCQVWGGAIWSVRDGPAGPRTLCNNCGLLYEQNKALPPWSRDLYAGERDCGTVSSIPAPPTIAARPPPPQPSQSYQHHQQIQPAPLRPQQSSATQQHGDYYANNLNNGASASPGPRRESSQPRSGSTSMHGAFVPNPSRALSQTFYRHSTSFAGNSLQSSQLSEQYAATLRGGGPQMFDDYSVEGEDLDWTKVTDPRERKRLQNIINGRKYRERRLAMDGEGGPGSPGGGGYDEFGGELGGGGGGGSYGGAVPY